MPPEVVIRGEATTVAWLGTWTSSVTGTPPSRPSTTRTVLSGPGTLTSTELPVIDASATTAPAGSTTLTALPASRPWMRRTTVPSHRAYTST